MPINRNINDLPKIATREGYGSTLVELGKQDETIVVLDADLAAATKTGVFGKAFPDRHFNCGIAEGNMAGIAAGLAASGKIPFISSFAMFVAGRAYEQIRNSIGYPGLNVKIGATHAGISVGEDGATHQCNEDIALMRSIPGMVIINPSDNIEAMAAVRAAYAYKGPVYLRFGRLAVPVFNDREDYTFELGKGIVLREGKDITIFATGLCVVETLYAAEKLAAEAFGAAHAFLMVGGTTSSVQSMILASCKRGDEIILPRNVHKSVINALVLCGAVPVYVNPDVDQRLGISLGMRREQVAKAIAEHPDAVAVLVNNPTYYGVCSDLRAIVKMAHAAGMRCLADEAHGTHFYFGGGLPVSAMAAGADMASVSMHKSGGSLTQSSLLLVGPNVHAGYVRQIINLTQTTSGSYLLMSSLDISRRNLALRGRTVFHQVADMAEYARQEINAVGGYYAFGRELMNGDSVFDFDTTKLSVHTLDIGLAGIEVYDILRDEYDIQIEFGDIGNILAYLSMGDRAQEVERLVSALAEIRRRYQRDPTGLLNQEYVEPEVVASPQEAFYAEKHSLPLEETRGRVCSEFVMCYPPGIPLLAPGERITAEILEHIRYAKEKGCSMTGPEDPDLERLNVLA